MVRTLKVKLNVGSDKIQDVAKRAVAAACNRNCNGSHQLPERNFNPASDRLRVEQRQRERPLLSFTCECAPVFATPRNEEEGQEEDRDARDQISERGTSADRLASADPPSQEPRSKRANHALAPVPAQETAPRQSSSDVARRQPRARVDGRRGHACSSAPGRVPMRVRAS